MKSTSKFLSAVTLGLTSMLMACSMGSNMQMVSEYPSQYEIQARQINASHRLNTCAMGPSRVDVIVRFNSATDKLSKQGAMEVKKAAAILSDPSFSGSHVTVEGYTDAAGKDAANLDLSYRRALTVMHTLVDQYGLPASMLSAQGFGKANPVATNSTAAGRAANRRVTFAVTK